MFNITFSYVNLFVEGTATPPETFTITLWRSFTSIDTDGEASEHHLPLETKSITAANLATLPLSFTEGPALNDAGSFIMLTAAIPGTNGFAFKSGRLSSIPLTAPDNPEGNMSVLALPVQNFGNAEVASSLPPLPITFNTDTVADLISSGAVTSLSGAFNSAGNLVITIGGVVAPKPLGPLPLPPSVSFTNTYTFRIDPNPEPHSNTNYFTAVLLSETGMNWGYGALPGNIANAVLGLITGILNVDVLSRVTERIETAVNSAAIAAVNGQITTRCQTVTSLRPDISLNIMNVVPQSGALMIESSLSCFGVVLNKLCQPLTPAPNPGGGKGGCALPVLVMLAIAVICWILW
jgi:hypothetical protein